MVTRLLVLAYCICPIVPGQEVVQFELSPGPTTWSSRGDLGTGGGETLQGIHAGYHSGIGDGGTGCSISGFTARIQDQEQATQETFRWIVRAGTDAAGPGLDPQDVIVDMGPFTAPSEGTGVAAWLITTTLGTPLSLPDCTSHISFGLVLPPAPAWPLDGLSTHASPDSEQNSHAGQQDHAWQVIDGNVSHPSDKRTWRYGLLVENAGLQLGSNDMYGMGGMFPRTGSSLKARIRYGSSMAGGTSALFIGTNRGPGTFVLPGTSKLYLGPAPVLVSLTTIEPFGDAVHPLFSSLPSRFAGLGPFYLQAGALEGSTWKLSNLQAMKL